MLITCISIMYAIQALQVAVCAQDTIYRYADF